MGVDMVDPKVQDPPFVRKSPLKSEVEARELERAKLAAQKALDAAKVNPATNARNPLMGYTESLADILARGDQLESLKALRDYLVDQLTDETPEYVVVKITQQLVSIIKEIAVLTGDKPAASAMDEVKRKREERLAQRQVATG